MAGEADPPRATDEEVAAEKVAAELYEVLATGDRERLDAILHPEFEGRTAEGMPFGLGGVYRGPDSMWREFWGRIAQHYRARAVPREFLWSGDGRLSVVGRYQGKARVGGGTLDAEFVHTLTFVQGRIAELSQLTDTALWHDALKPKSGLRTVEFEVSDGVAVLRLNRPEQRNAIDPAMAGDLYEVAQRCVGADDIRALVLLGNGPAFTVGGDIEVFADTDPDSLATTLRRMVTPYHEALRIFTELPVPIITGVRGAVGGGGLGMLYCADVALAAERTKFATGFTALGLSGDGGTSWYLPRLVGLRRAQEMYLGRVLDATQACEWGLVSAVVPEDRLEQATFERAGELAAGPTRAYAEIRRLLRDSATATLPQQLNAEIESITRTGGTADAAQAVRSFLSKTKPAFQGQ
ncbi:enoyl-CoA hydratase-related protein [Nocardia vaccinii]|uniref:enoyl-CoA hydratase-related protein n=1 Tax=Nocardia vaccinii TaxID=1822 RepID=UPI00082A7C09|nr:enoyl-CoA hydratase-related protein [Nocardia vaccinii]